MVVFLVAVCCLLLVVGVVCVTCFCWLVVLWRRALLVACRVLFVID